MKKVIAGGIFLFCGVILYLGIYIPASKISSTLGGWSTPPGRLGTALSETGGTMPLIYAVIMMAAGACLLLWGCFLDDILRKKDRNQVEASQQSSIPN
ncbi:hypothetical protein [Paenibacillus sp. 1011MAR3C5]|uniref:hypothetical protein n=1 Tax=Paenibacillus sp. 1011MAR3C5 TaxID=1675787 RepID=UPI0011C397F1|nr:hypothetical protein [Paenibacillus sp. 1011MAR3C5]